MINTFVLTLLASHAVADYPLQTNQVFAFKVKSFWGIVLHVLIFTFLSLGALIAVGFRLNSSILWFLALLTLLHIIEDKLKLCCYRGNELFWYVVDQLVHVFCICLAYLLPLELAPAGWYPGALVNIYLIGITATVMGSYASSLGIYFYCKSFIDKRLIYQRDWLEIIELAILTLVLFVFITYWWLTILLFILFKFIFLGQHRKSARFYIVRITISLIAAFAFRFLLSIL
jgi:hypothetical protein